MGVRLALVRLRQSMSERDRAMPTDDLQARLRLDYTETTDLLQHLTDIRFKLLAFIPTISGAAVAILSRKPSTAELLAVGTIGLVATLGVVLYELRNTQIYEYALHRAAGLEARLGQSSISDPEQTGGLYGERPGHDRRIFGLAAAGHDRALALVYGAAVGGWSYLLPWGILHALDITNPQKIGGVVGVAVGALVVVELVRVDGNSTE